MMVIDNKYELQQIVYLKTDTAQMERVIVGILVTTGVQYQLAGGDRTTWHYDFEISETKDILKATTA